jgi:hypothetical protein
VPNLAILYVERQHAFVGEGSQIVDCVPLNVAWWPHTGGDPPMTRLMTYLGPILYAAVFFVSLPSIEVSADPHPEFAIALDGENPRLLTVANFHSTPPSLADQSVVDFAYVSDAPEAQAPNLPRVFLHILMADGGGGYTSDQSILPIPIGSNPIAMAAGDFKTANPGSLSDSSQSKIDLAIIDASDNTLLVLSGIGPSRQGGPPPPVVKNQMFVRESLSSDPMTPTAIAVGSFRGADKPRDIAVVAMASGQGEIIILEGDGTGNFTPGPVTRFRDCGGGHLPGPASVVGDVVAGDFDHDGNLDLAIQFPNNNLVQIFTNNGNGEFRCNTQKLSDQNLRDQFSRSGAAGQLLADTTVDPVTDQGPLIVSINESTDGPIWNSYLRLAVPGLSGIKEFSQYPSECSSATGHTAPTMLARTHGFPPLPGPFFWYDATGDNKLSLATITPVEHLPNAGSGLLLYSFPRAPDKCGQNQPSFFCTTFSPPPSPGTQGSCSAHTTPISFVGFVGPDDFTGAEVISIVTGRMLNDSTGDVKPDIALMWAKTTSRAIACHLEPVTNPMRQFACSHEEAPPGRCFCEIPDDCHVLNQSTCRAPDCKCVCQGGGGPPQNVCQFQTVIAPAFITVLANAVTGSPPPR